ncbi:hypothetical protein ACXX7I_003996 [Enterobacter hormaechei]
MTFSVQTALSAATDIDDVIAVLTSLPIHQRTTGRASYVVTSKGAEVKTAFKVVEVAVLTISNNLDGTINPDFPSELQPRDRTRLSSKLQVSKIASGLRPAQLTDSGMSSHGAPIVGPDNVVESGNGRSMGIWRAYQQDQANDYRQYLIDHAEEFGLKASDVAAMEMPVLVRERLTDIDRAQFARDSNISDLQEMAASEKAYAGAQFLSESVMALFNPSEDGNLLARSNDGFIRAFLREIGDTATAGLLTNDGRPTKQLIDRVQNAIFAKAYKDERLVRLIAEEPDPDMRNILTALNTAASDFAQMQSLSGDIHHDAVTGLVDGIETIDGLDKQAIAALQEAINLVREAKDNGQALEEVIAQRGLFGDSTPEAEALALFIVTNNRSAKRMGAAFKKLAQKINDELTHQQQALGDMFGGGGVDLRSVLTAVSQEIESEFGEGKGLNFAMFESAPGEVDPYISDLISRASDVSELVRIVRLSEQIKSNVHSGEQNVKDLGFKLRFFNYNTVREWISNNGYSDGVVRAMISSVDKSMFYSSALKTAIEDGHSAPSLVDPRNIHYAIEHLNDAAQNGGNTERVIRTLHQLENLVPSEISWPEVQEACIKWFATNQKLPPNLKKSLLASFTKKMSSAKTVQQLVAAIQNAEKLAKKMLSDISGVMESGKAVLERVGLSRDIDINVIADGYISALNSLKQIGTDVDPGNIGFQSTVDFYIEQINKVQDNPEKLKPYLKAVFDKNSGLALDVRHLKMILRAHPERDRLELEMDDLSRLFSDRVAYPPAITTMIHKKVKAAFDTLLETGGVTAEQASEWSEGIRLSDQVDELTAQDQPDYGRKGFSIKEVAAKAYELVGGNLASLNHIYHSDGVRAYANRNGVIAIEGNTDGEHVLWHEIGHHIEYSNPHLLERAKAFLKSKAGDRLTYYNTGTRGDAEYMVRSALSDRYMSKIYMELNFSAKSGKPLSKPPALNNCRSTEIFSMGMQLYADPEAAAKSVLNGDGLVEFFLGCMKEIHHAD